LETAFQLGAFGPEATLAVPALTACLRDDPRDVVKGSVVCLRGMAARALGNIGPRARSAVPRLVPLLADKDPTARVYAAIALWRIDGQVSATLPILIREPPHFGVDKREVLDALGEMGPTAKEAVPAILPELNNASPGLAVRAAWALWRIDPTQTPFIVDTIIAPRNRTSFSLLALEPEASKLLVHLEGEAKRAVPELVRVLQGARENEPISNAIAHALLQLDPKSAARVGLK
jgi:hypothetical protein